MSKHGWIVWPEAKPERARHCTGWLHLWWRELLCWPRRSCRLTLSTPPEHPIVEARKCERTIRRARGLDY